MTVELNINGDPISQTLSEEKMIRIGAIQLNAGWITSDGQYWMKSNCSSPRTGTWFTSDGVPSTIWADLWTELAVREVMDS